MTAAPASAPDTARLRAALATFHAGPTPERQQWLAVQVCAATLLLPVKIDGAPGVSPGQIVSRLSLPPGAQVGLALCADDQGTAMLPLFTTVDEAAALVRQGCCLMAIPAAQLWPLALGQAQLGGVLIDPDGHGWALDRAAIEWLAANGAATAALAAQTPPP